MAGFSLLGAAGALGAFNILRGRNFLGTRQRGRREIRGNRSSVNYKKKSLVMDSDVAE